MSGYEYDANLGFINSKHQRVAEVIKDIDPDIEIMYNQQLDRFALQHSPHDGREIYTFLHVDGSEFDHRVIQAILESRAATQGRPGDLASRIERADAARKLVEYKELEEKLAEEKDMALFLWKTPLHRVKMDNGRVYNL